MIDDKLTVSSKLGKNLIKEALEKRIDQQKQQVVGEVNTIMERLSVMQGIEEKTERRIKLLKTQLSEINQGHFKIDDRTGKILFDNSDLNIDWSSTERW